MGFFKNLFFKLITTEVGKTSGGNFNGWTITTGHKDGKDAIVLIGKNEEPFGINKNDVKELTVFESSVILPNELGLGNKYKLVLNDGKDVILNIPIKHCPEIEKMFY